MLKYLLLIKTLLEQLVTGNITGLLQVFKSSLNTVQKDIAALLMPYMVDGKLNVPLKQRGKLIKQLDKTLREQANVIGKKDIEVTSKILNQSATESYYRTGFLLEAGLDEAIKLNPLKANELRAIVNTPIHEDMFSDRIWKNKAKLVKQVRYSFEQAMINGTDPRKLAKEVQRTFNVSAYESRRLINNEVARVSRQAQDQVYEQAGVKEVMFDATLDKKTSHFCREHDGQFYKFGEHPKIPEETHVQCRSDIIPIVDGWKPRVKRENIKNEDGVKPIIDYSNYSQWMKDKGFN
ncbi:minor capsid protein [Mesobacillus foraminis]|uniref:SPP1 gp7 family putative phage head morphogenesis protein n=1 Tax=Mesobacillus foraminis TaxID=279826 RepID=A0A4V2RDN5_9BACI|nr:minor capsid protein [Mesobacillus foraminis]TCN25490.1 SPP1 gp7 family putative phage head morphogenesis protein [Mesobacillus foraminis]